MAALTESGINLPATPAIFVPSHSAKTSGSPAIIRPAEELRICRARLQCCDGHAGILKLITKALREFKIESLGRSLDCLERSGHGTRDRSSNQDALHAPPSVFLQALARCTVAFTLRSMIRSSVSRSVLRAKSAPVPIPVLSAIASTSLLVAAISPHNRSTPHISRGRL